MKSRTSSQSPTFNISMAQSFNNNNSKLLLGLRSTPPAQPSSTAPASPTDTNSEATEWVARCKRILIDMESRNIKTRAEFWTTFVNDATSKAMDKVESLLSKLNLNYEEVEKFAFAVPDPENEHLKFLSEWTGLKTQQMQYMPKSYSEFEYKSKNWLNGRKAPNYAQTLFPSMIHRAEEYAENLSSQLFPSNSVAKNLLSTALRFGYLGKLCSAKISLNDTGRKTPLLIENSIKTAKSKTSKIFQQYAIDHPYSSQFPNHTSEAAQYFDAKHEDCLQRFVDHVQQNGNCADYTMELNGVGVPGGVYHASASASMALPPPMSAACLSSQVDTKLIPSLGNLGALGALGNLPSIPFPSNCGGGNTANHNIPPSLSGSSVTSNDNQNNCNGNNNQFAGNIKLDMDTLPPPTSLCTPTPNSINASFAFHMPPVAAHSFRCTVSNLSSHETNGHANSAHNIHDMHNMISPGSTNTNSTFVSAPSLPINSPSIATTTTSQNNHNNNTQNHQNAQQFTLRSPNSGNVILTDSQYNQLMTQLDRLTSTQKEQKNTITQLVTRLHSLEQVIDNQRQVINQFPVSASNQSMSGHSSSDQHQFWNGNGQCNNGGAAPAGTPSCGYSLAQDFANAKSFASANSLSSSSHNGTPTLTTNSSSTHTPHSPHTPSALYNYFNPHQNARAAAVVVNANKHMSSHNRHHENDDDMEMSEPHQHHNEDSDMNHLHALHAHALNGTLPPFFDGAHDMTAFTGNANLNGFSNFM